MEKEQMTSNGIHVAVYVNDEWNEIWRKLAYIKGKSKSTIGNIALKEYYENHKKELNTAILNGK